MSRIRLSSALRRTRNSSGERSSSSRRSSTGSSRRIERVARPSENRSTEMSEVASIWPAASSKPTSWEKSSSGPISTLTRPSKRFCAACSIGPGSLAPPRPRSAPGRGGRPRPPRAAPSSGSGSPGHGPAPGSLPASRKPSPARQCCDRGVRWPRQGARAGRGSRARARSPSPRPRRAPARRRRRHRRPRASV